MDTRSFAAAPLLALAAFASAAPECRHVVFQPEDPPVSRPVTLSSGTDTRTVRLSLPDRKRPLPWESDVFRVCLAGSAPRVEVVSAAHDYAVVRDGAADGTVVLTCGARRLLPPDPRGVQAALTPGLTLRFHDQWAEYYPGGTVVLRIALRREASFWPDETVVEKRIELPVAENYFVELGGARVAPGGVYYVRYAVARPGGTVSTEAETPALETRAVSCEPGGALPGG